MQNDELSPIYSRSEVERDKSLFRVGQRVAVNMGGNAENRTEGVIRSIRELPTLTTYEVQFDGYRTNAGIDTFYMAEALSPLG